MKKVKIPFEIVLILYPNAKVYEYLPRKRKKAMKKEIKKVFEFELDKFIKDEDYFKNFI